MTENERMSWNLSKDVLPEIGKTIIFIFAPDVDVGYGRWNGSEFIDLYEAWGYSREEVSHWIYLPDVSGKEV